VRYVTFKALLHCGGKDCFHWHIIGSWQKCLCNLMLRLFTSLFFRHVLNSGNSHMFVGNLKRSS